MGSLEMYDRNTCIKKVYKYCYSLPQKLNSIDYDYFSVLLWSLNEIVFLFKQS